jgi:hypothetical protein
VDQRVDVADLQFSQRKFSYRPRLRRSLQSFIRFDGKDDAEVESASNHAKAIPVWHVICSANIELVARVPHLSGWLVRELPPEREKSAQDTAG